MKQSILDILQYLFAKNHPLVFCEFIAGQV